MKLIDLLLEVQPRWYIKAQRYKKAGSSVDGLKVGGRIDNTDSIASSLNDYVILRGIRELPMSDFTKWRYAAADDQKRSRILAQEIEQNGKISPLIVGIDDEGPWILEGGHRFVALSILKKKKFPALVVIDMSSIENADKLYAKQLRSKQTSIFQT